MAVLNHTKDELILDSGSAHLAGKGLLAPADPKTAPVLSPAGIQPGESVIWRCNSTGIGRGIRGSVVYRLAGSEPPHHRVRFNWKTRTLGPNQYSAKTSDDNYHVEIKGGEGDPAVVVFIFCKYPIQPPCLRGIFLLECVLPLSRRMVADLTCDVCSKEVKRTISIGGGSDTLEP